ncbi:hypothetical protein FA10DRAFT_301505 [Acaromyces ingoldii]|uniref:Acyltransferase MbtK/IucB-like conserved domain-containing protein n=1 Tax=Acaromyces ingoldii TaxID=215250 RepID=A0A316YQB9_9BASI|nr:hypothetical protein FA10DRAFT_301505 [Acaromyces ingoldii]PWN90233.1 hypothetical protein FA10DRAFT_301505 [Acaromyces ingoldii]
MVDNGGSVINLSKALSQLDTSPSSLSKGASRQFDLLLPDGSAVTLDIGIHDAGTFEHDRIFKASLYLRHRAIEENGHSSSKDDSYKPVIASKLDTRHFPLEMYCQPPKPRYGHPNEEPDDNSPAERSTRLANARLDVGKSRSEQPDDVVASLWIQLYALHTLFPNEEAFNVATSSASSTASRDTSRASSSAAALLLASGLAVPHPTHSSPSSSSSPASSSASSTSQFAANTVLATRSAFWQSSYPFSRPPWILPSIAVGDPQANAHAFPTSYTFSNNINHPVRPPKLAPDTSSPLYRRFSIELNQTLTFEVTSFRNDETVDLVTRWHNTDRVADGWRQRGDRDKQRQYLESVEASPSNMGIVGKWDGAPWGYLEIYYAKESNVGQYSHMGDYDRGFHALVGEEGFRGPHRVRTWMGSLIHLLFLLDPRTEKVVLEPRASNTKMIDYAIMCGGHVEKLIDLPHKRAALVVIPRQRFFQLCPFGPLNA